MKKKILFRVDAGESVGLGHFYRSHNLAKELEKHNYLVTFAHLPSDFWSKVEDFDFKQIELNEKNANEHMLNLCLEQSFDILYVDGIIDFNETDINLLAGKVTTVFYQNISNSRHLSDVFILPSIHQEASFFDIFDPAKTTIFKGLKYVTFNASISKLKPKKCISKRKVNEVGIICGGSDPRNVMLSLYKMIDFLEWQPIKFNFYYGNNYMHKESLPNSYSKNVNFLEYDVNKIIKNDILISAFGVSTYEFMALGMPIISLGHQPTNATASKFLAEKTDAIMHLGLIDDITSITINKAIKTLVKDLKKAKELSEKARSTIDLKGVERVKNIIERL